MKAIPSAPAGVGGTDRRDGVNGGCSPFPWRRGRARMRASLGSESERSFRQAAPVGDLPGWGDCGWTRSSSAWGEASLHPRSYGSELRLHARTHFRPTAAPFSSPVVLARRSLPTVRRCWDLQGRTGGIADARGTLRKSRAPPCCIRPLGPARTHRTRGLGTLLAETIRAPPHLESCSETSKSNRAGWTPGLTTDRQLRVYGHAIG